MQNNGGKIMFFARNSFRQQAGAAGHRLGKGTSTLISGAPSNDSDPRLTSDQTDLVI